MKDTLLDIRQKLEDRVYSNEEHVRLSLVGRILLELGWDLWNPREVNSEFQVLPQEDSSRVDLALFSTPFSPDIFIEVKSVGKLTGNIGKTERQLRDYNRNNTALFSIITDGRKWFFYYSQTGGEFSQKRFKKLDILKDDVDDLKMFFDIFLSKERISNGTAEREAKDYLQLSRKQRAMEDALPKAKRLVNEPPFPTLPQAVVNLTREAGQTVNEEEASQFIQESASRDTIAESETFIPPIIPKKHRPPGKNKAWYYWEDRNGRGHILAFVNGKRACSMRRFDADSGVFIVQDPNEKGKYQENFAEYIRQKWLLYLSRQPNLLHACKEGRLPDWVLTELRPQIRTILESEQKNR